MKRICPWALLLAGCLNPDTSFGDTDDEESTAGDAATSSSMTPPATTTDPLPSTCDNVPMRVATFNVEAVGPTTSEEYDALTEILLRIDADVVCLQEVLHLESANVRALAEAVGYGFVIEADNSPAIGGEIKNACIGKVPLTFVESYGGNELSPDGSNDVGRDILAVRAEPADGCFVGLFAVHFKSGTQFEDLYRRLIEVERTVQAVAAYRQTRPADGLVILGDLNEQVGDPELGTEVTEEPSGLPQSYETGSDIEFPLIYDPFARLMGVGFTMAAATWENDTLTTTWGMDRRDYVFYGQATAAGAEVYNACRDEGAGLAKPGEPLPCPVSAAASDHLPVLVDLVL